MIYERINEKINFSNDNSFEKYRSINYSTNCITRLDIPMQKIRKKITKQKIRKLPKQQPE